MTFFVIQCPNCGNYQAQESNKQIHLATFKCRRCGISRKTKRKNEFMLGLKVKFQTENPRKAARIVAILNGQDEQGRERKLTWKTYQQRGKHNDVTLSRRPQRSSSRNDTQHVD